MAQKFLRAETYARVKGRPDKRQALAVMIGMNGRPAPLLEILRQYFLVQQVSLRFAGRS
jgi:hypothetical protein